MQTLHKWNNFSFQLFNLPLQSGSFSTTRTSHVNIRIFLGLKGWSNWRSHSSFNKKDTPSSESTHGFNKRAWQKMRIREGDRASISIVSKHNITLLIYQHKWITICNTTEANASQIQSNMDQHAIIRNKIIIATTTWTMGLIWLYQHRSWIYNFLMILSPRNTAPLSLVEAGAQTGQGETSHLLTIQKKS